MNTVRPYASTLRDDQAQQTRARIVEAATALIAGGVAAVTMPLVAKAAGVALRTVFRHFPTREELLDAIWDTLNARMGETPELATLDQVTDFIPDLFARYGAMEDQIRAAMLSPVLDAARLRKGSPRRRKMMAAIDGLVSDPDDRRQAMARSAAYTLTIPTAMLFLKDNYGLTTAEAAAAAAWAVETLVEAAKTNPPPLPKA